MAEIIGELRDDATYGEKQTLKFLQQNLPKEFTIYVEVPINLQRERRYPDFIIVTNYGVIVLEVKDWVKILKIDKIRATILTRENKQRTERCPVDTARDYAIALNDVLRNPGDGKQPLTKITWSHAAILYNLRGADLSWAYQCWGEDFIISRADLQNPDILLKKIKRTIPSWRMNSLKKEELDRIRAIVFPLNEADIPGREPVILDEQQEKIVAEPVVQAPSPAEEEASPVRQEGLFVEQAEEEKKEKLPPEGRRLSQNVAIRLVRGISGSGKTLVLIQRARYLAACHPEWKIGVFTYNQPLQRQLEGVFRGTQIRPRTFDSLCRKWVMLPEDKNTDFSTWVKTAPRNFPILEKIDTWLIEREIDWLRDMGVTEREEYLGIERRGVGKDLRLLAEDRQALFDVYEAYRAYLKNTGSWDWYEARLMALEALEKNGPKEDDLYDAILIDEAQDWAPAWLKIITRLVKPEQGLIFMVDDPSQSIYRMFSWREKGVEVVGRTRWLRVPYRNTYEIYQAAYRLIAENRDIQQALAEEGEIIKPEVSSDTMRHGPRPLIHCCVSLLDELDAVRNSVATLKQEGYSEEQILVLAHYNSDYQRLKTTLQGSGVIVDRMKRYKGLEMEAVIIPFLQRSFRNLDESSDELRLLYMAMTRARSKLVLTSSGKLPAAIQELVNLRLVDMIK